MPSQILIKNSWIGLVNVMHLCTPDLQGLHSLVNFYFPCRIANANENWKIFNLCEDIYWWKELANCLNFNFLICQFYKYSAERQLLESLIQHRYISWSRLRPSFMSGHKKWCWFWCVVLSVEQRSSILISKLCVTCYLRCLWEDMNISRWKITDRTFFLPRPSLGLS